VLSPLEIVARDPLSEGFLVFKLAGLAVFGLEDIVDKGAIGLSGGITQPILQASDLLWYNLFL